MNDLKNLVQEAHAQVKDLKGGKNANYIPFLDKIDSNLFGISVCLPSGEVITVGDTDYVFGIESVSKVYTAILVLRQYGAQAVLDQIGADATGLPFNSIMAILLENDHPSTPLVNAGAISADSMVKPIGNSDAKWKAITDNMKELSGSDLQLLDELYKSESETNFNNRSIAWLLKNFNRIYDEPNMALDLYTRQCSMGVTAKQLSIAACTIANGGLNPVTKQQVFDASLAPKITSLIATVGFYEHTGDWLYTSGVPAKSGVGGGVLGVVPGIFGIAAFAPPLDEAGNSVKAQCDTERKTTMRQLKREVKIGNVTIGGNNPIAVQTMLNVPVEDIEGNVAQAKRCEAAGCQILRVTCPSAADAKCIEAVKNAVNIPIVADIHFDYKAALACADVGVDKIRINPGNIGDDDRVKAVVQACQQKNIPIRIGVNGGSLEKHILAKYGAPVPEAMVESALYHVRLLEKFDFNNIVISIKNSNVPRMMEAYRQLSAVTDYPLHVGVTEAGTYQMGLLKSGMGIGGMLLEGIGDTIRVSLAAEPEKEVEAGYNILRAVGFPVAGPEVITCPTCGRTQYPCTEIANEVEKRLQGYKKSIKVAVMGCVVNGPGEAREADIGIAGGKGEAVLFIHGQPIKKLTGDNILDQFMEEIYKI